MTPERWQEVKELLGVALEMEPAERTPFLERTCAHDSFLRREVERLLAVEERAGTNFLRDPAIAGSLNASVNESADAWIGRRVGPYKIVERIGIGGMGEVYRAFRADDQYRMQVALKVVRGGQDSGFVVNRFKNERQILASLDHPNIARLHDGGTTEDGVPYFVMELIDGQLIDQYCNHHKLSVTERLKLFVQACSAVQYAHQRLIIHRDIKPSNILVTSDGTPKLLDFGIAKLLDPEAVTGQFETTLTVIRLLTPGYASPEQIKGEPITTASDVYSLGVVLYELLTGHHPYHRPSSTPQEIADAVCEVEPEKPSVVAHRMETADKHRDSQGSAAVPEIPDRPAEKLRKRLRGDLDNIVLMALRKDPQRRYASVEQLAQDIRRHIEHLPVVARKDTVAYRTSKFIARHKVGVVVAALVTVALLSALGMTLRQARIARAERARAEQRFNDVRKLANSLMFDIHDAIRDLSGSTAARKLLVDRALQYLDSLAQESAGTPGLQRELAAAYERVGDVQGNQYFANLGDTAGAIESYRKALHIQLALAADEHASVDDRAALVGIYIKLAMCLRLTNDFQAALDSLQKAYPIAERLATGEKHSPESQEAFGGVSFGMANCFADMGDLARSVGYYRKSAAVREAITGGSPAFQAYVQTRLAGVYGYMSGVVHLQGDLDSALALQSKSRDILARLAASDPNNATLRQFLLQAEYGVGYSLAEKGLPAQALAHYRVALAGYRKLASADKHDVLALRYLGRCYGSKGAALAAQDNAAQGIESIRKAVQIFEALSSKDPSDTYFTLTDLANAYSGLAKAYSRLAVQPGTPDSARIASWQEARSWYERSLATWSRAQQKAQLGRFDAPEPGRIANEISQCDTALAKLRPSRLSPSSGLRR